MKKNTKKGQLTSEPINYIFALIVLGSLVVLGYKSVAFFTEKNCQSKLVKMNIDLSEATKLQASFIGSRKEKSYNLCNLERLYIIDSSKPVSFAEFKDFPVIINALKSKLQKNTFLIEQKEIKTAFYTPFIDLSSPYFLCLKPRNNKIELLLEGKGATTRLYPKSGLYDCTFNNTPIELTNEDLDELIYDIQNEFNMGDNDVIDTNDACLKRGFEESNISEKTKVRIRKCKGNFRYVERIPKCAIQELNRAIAEGEVIFSEPPSILKSDPIIMWEFTQGDEEKYYEIKKRIEESCKAQFKGVALKGKGEDPQVEKKPNKNISQRPVLLQRAIRFDIGHRNGRDVTKDARALDDDEVDINVNRILHLEFEEQLKNNGIVKVYARCEPSGLLILTGEDSVPLGSAQCDERFSMIDIKIVSPTFIGSVFDISTTLPTREVEYDFVDIRQK